MVILTVFSHTLFGEFLLNTVLVNLTDEGSENNTPPVLMKRNEVFTKP